MGFFLIRASDTLFTSLGIYYDMDHVQIKFLDDDQGEYQIDEEQGKFCFWVDQARKGKDVYVSEKNIDCKLARFKLGYTRDLNLAAVLIQWNDATTMDEATQYIDNTITLKRSQIIHLSKRLEDPDITIYIGTPEEVMGAVREYSRKSGKRVKGHLSALGAVCGELCSVPYSLQEPSLSIGCRGSKKRLFKKHEIAVAFPARS